MVSDPGAITLYEAIKFLGALVGGGGLTAIAVAYLGSRRPRPASEQAEQQRGASVGIQALLADHLAMERFTAEIKRLADAMEELARATNRRADLLDIANAVERLTHDRGN